ncbi:hypothetical protein QYE76_020671 [Lolium multiflorum]|uniref:Uncharacterized protein n=1 Tax=Lolium multiflorum TaxID=4521 RepID=A0AAD8VQ85_LOLMU|nr:hypothetical protein QYE76_020671 [Lolium multiflorum]
MGKKKGTGEAGSASGVSKASRDWCASTISNRDVNKLRTLGFISSDDDDEVPLAKRAKLFSGRVESTKEQNPSTADRTPPSRTTVVKIPVSKVILSASTPIPPAARDHNENILLKDELKKLKKKMKEEQDARREAAIAADEKEGVLRESITNLLNAADVTINRVRKLREDSMSDALSLPTESNIQVLGLLQKTKVTLSKLFSMIFPKMKQDKTLGDMADAFFVDPSEPIEVLKRLSRLFGAVLTFQLLMGHGLGSELEKLSKALPVDDNNCLVNLEPFKQSTMRCANQLLKLVDEAKTKAVPEAAPGSSSALP